MPDDSFKGEHTPCFGSDLWFIDRDMGPIEQTRRRDAATRLCVGVCPVYDECLVWAMSGVKVYGIVAGTTAEDRKQGRIAKDRSVPRECPECSRLFNRYTGGRPRSTCSKSCADRAWRKEQAVKRRRAALVAAVDTVTAGRQITSPALLAQYGVEP
jgi:hypothetical protein